MATDLKEASYLVRRRLAELSGDQAMVARLHILHQAQQAGCKMTVALPDGREMRIPEIIAAEAAGVSNYIVKPFSARELEARVRAVLRRAVGKRTPVMEVGDLRMDQAQHRVWVGGEQIEQTAMEFDLLAFLMTHPGRVFTPRELLEAVRGETYESFERSVDSHIKRLRQKIEPDPRNPRFVLTVFGVGYKLAKENV